MLKILLYREKLDMELLHYIYRKHFILICNPFMDLILPNVKKTALTSSFQCSPWSHLTSPDTRLQENFSFKSRQQLSQLDFIQVSWFNQDCSFLFSPLDVLLFQSQVLISIGSSFRFSLLFPSHLSLSLTPSPPSPSFLLCMLGCLAI